jgi:hypothetical protein
MIGMRQQHRVGAAEAESRDVALLLGDAEQETGSIGVE